MQACTKSWEHGLYIQLASPHNNVIACYGAARMHTLVSWHLVTTNICMQKLQDSLLYARSRPSLLAKKPCIQQPSGIQRASKSIMWTRVQQLIYLSVYKYMLFSHGGTVYICIYTYIQIDTYTHIYIYIYPRFTLHSRFLFVGAPLHIQVGLRNPLQNSYYPRPYKSYKP